jgi:putative tricarboxylic transport membrane protein
MRDPPRKAIINSFDAVVPRIADVVKYWRTIIRSGIIGTGIGIIPGVGEDVAAWSSYAAARRASKEKELFGKGSVEGLMAAETGDNACVPGSVIPVLTLAVPGSAPAAVLLAAMLIHGVQPGPLIMVNSPQFVFDVVAMMLLASFGILFYGLTLTHVLIRILQVPQVLVMPVVFVLCVVGSFAIASRLFDVHVMLVFGIIGYVLRRMNYPMAPLVLGIVLGDILDKSLRRGLVLSDGDLTPFFTRPISVVLFLLVAGTILLNIPAVHRAAVAVWVRVKAPLSRPGARG